MKENDLLFLFVLISSCIIKVVGPLAVTGSAADSGRTVCIIKFSSLKNSFLGVNQGEKEGTIAFFKERHVYCRIIL